MTTKTASFEFRFFCVLMLITLLNCAVGVTPTYAAGILYAKPGGTGDCSSWAKSCKLQSALTSAISGKQIWAKAGTYKPTTNSADRYATFQLKNGVAVYGGFAGTETALTQRNPTVNVTVLSGDIDNNDSQTPIITNLNTVTGNKTNSYQVVNGVTGATLDGFTITAGYANDTNDPTDEGGGMFNYQSSPTVTNVVFRGNYAGSEGGGMYNNESSPTVMNVTFSGNQSGDEV